MFLFDGLNNTGTPEGRRRDAEKSGSVCTCFLNRLLFSFYSIFLQAVIKSVLRGFVVNSSVSAFALYYGGDDLSDERWPVGSQMPVGFIKTFSPPVKSIPIAFFLSFFFLFFSPFLFFLSLFLFFFSFLFFFFST